MTSHISAIALLTSFIAGLVSFLSPCVLPLVPAYLSYIAGQRLEQNSHEFGFGKKIAALPLSACFVLGFSTVFVILGASATALGQLLLSYRYQANIIAGAAVILFGLVMVGLVRWHGFQREFRFHINLRGGRPLTGYALGLGFAFGWTPCIGPVLGAILTTSAVSLTVNQGVVLLIAYSLGLGVPFLATALVTDRLFDRVRTMGRASRYLQVGAGSVMVAMGAAMITGQLSAFSSWLLGTFPVLARIG
jgi:cytochrome c-type biogenesis protein